MLKLKIDKDNCILCPKNLPENIGVHINRCKNDFSDDACKYFVLFDKIFTDGWHVVCKYDKSKKAIEKVAKIIEDYVEMFHIDFNGDYNSLAEEILAKTRKEIGE